MVPQNIIDIIILGASQLFNFFILVTILRLGHFRFFSAKHQNKFIICGEILIIYAVLAFTVLRIKSKRLGSKIGLTRDRYHTLFPKTVLSLVLAVLISYPLMCYGTILVHGKLAIIIVSLLYHFVYQSFKLISKFDRDI